MIESKNQTYRTSQIEKKYKSNSSQQNQWESNNNLGQHNKNKKTKILL